MRRLLPIVCATLALAILGCQVVSAQSIDTDVRAARAAERSESVSLEKKLDAPDQSIGLSVTESPSPDSSKAEPAAPTVKGTTGHKATHRSAPKVSKPSVLPVEPDKSVTSDAVVTPLHSNRPDKVALMLGAETPAQADKKQPGAFTTIISTILKLALVLVLAYLTIMGLKWFSSRHDMIPSNHRQFRMVDTLRFNNTSSLHLVEVKGATLLLGCASGQVSVLKEFEDGQSADVESETSGKFAEYLAKYSDMSRKHGPSGRIAGLLRDCSGYLRDRCQGTRTEVRDEK